jgi:predicted nucleic acid-binding protein
LDEWLEVLSLPRIRARHGLSDDEILEFLASLIVSASQFPGKRKLPHSLTRDMTDTKFLTLAAESRAEYLVTNDRRHLLPLKRFLKTKIVTPAQFVSRLPQNG